MAQGARPAWQRSVSRQRAPDGARRRESSAQTRAGASPTGARNTKKSSEHLLTGIQMKYQFIEQYKHEFPVVVMCQVLGVSESGFYAWRKRPPCRRKREDALLTEQIRQVFNAHRERYGSPRVHAELAEQGRSCSRKRVA